MSVFGRFWSGKVLPHVPKIVRNDFWRILFSLFFALLLTAYAHRNVKLKTDMVKMQLKDIPVYFIPAAGENFALVPRETRPTVDISVEYPGELKDLKNTDFYVEYAVTKARIDAKTPEPVKLKPDNVKTRRVIDNLNVQAIHPELLSLDLDYFVEKDVPVSPVYDEREVMPGYRVVGESAENRVKVRIRGPKKLLETIDHLETEKIPLSNMNRGFSRLVHPALPNDMRDDNVRILSDTVRVDVRIEKKVPKSIELVPVRILAGRSGAGNLAIVSVEPENVTVNVDDVPGISREQIYPFLDLSGLTQPGVYPVEIKCWSDNEYVNVVNVVPGKATVKLEFAAPAPVSK